MLGAIIGYVAGSVYEFRPVQGCWEDFPLFTPESSFTDDTVMTLAVADALRLEKDPARLPAMLIDKMHEYGRRWPRAGYGMRFAQWLMLDERDPYNSFGNGSAMRVAAAGWAASSLEEAEELAGLSAEVTHNHPEGIKGAQATAGAIYLARQGKSRQDIRDYAAQRHGYDMDRSLAKIRETYRYDVTCQGSVPEAIIAFLESEDFEQAIRKAIWLRGDADTQAAIAGSIAEAFYGGAPASLAGLALGVLDKGLLESYQKNSAWLNGNHS